MEHRNFPEFLDWLYEEKGIAYAGNGKDMYGNVVEGDIDLFIEFTRTLYGNSDFDFPEFDELTETQRNLFDEDPKSTYESMGDKYKANFLNLTSRAAQIGLDLSDLYLRDPSANSDRLILDGSTNALLASFNAAIKAGTISGNAPSSSHRYNDWGGRQKVGRYSLQLGAGVDNKGIVGAELDIDLYNPEDFPVGTIGHVGEVLWNKLTGSKTNPFVVGKGLGKEVTGYECD